MEIRLRALVPVSLLALSVAAFACGGHKKPPVAVEPTADLADSGPAEAEAPPAPKSLYERLGGKEGMKAVIETFVKNLQADNRVNKAFAKTTGPKLDRFKQMLADQICEASGGADCKYTGKSMKDAHKGMKITEAQFNAVIEDLRTSLDEHKVAQPEQSDLFALLAPMKDDIVEVKPKGK